MITIKKKEHLVALSKALRALKFECDEDTVFIFAGSPHIAEIQRQLHSTLLKESNPNLSTEEIQQIHIDDYDFKKREHLFTKVKGYLEKTSTWNLFSLAIKKEYISNLVSPYFIDESFLMELIEETDAFHS